MHACKASFFFVSGQKYEFACKWKLHIVSEKWVTDSIAAGYCLREYNYRMGDKKGPEHSTPSTSRPAVHADTSKNGRKRNSNITGVFIKDIENGE